MSHFENVTKIQFYGRYFHFHSVFVCTKRVYCVFFCFDEAVVCIGRKNEIKGAVITNVSNPDDWAIDIYSSSFFFSFSCEHHFPFTKITLVNKIKTTIRTDFLFSTQRHPVDDEEEKKNKKKKFERKKRQQQMSVCEHTYNQINGVNLFKRILYGKGKNV